MTVHCDFETVIDAAREQLMLRLCEVSGVWEVRRRYAEGIPVSTILVEFEKYESAPMYCLTEMSNEQVSVAVGLWLVGRVDDYLVRRGDRRWLLAYRAEVE